MELELSLAQALALELLVTMDSLLTLLIMFATPAQLISSTMILHKLSVSLVQVAPLAASLMANLFLFVDARKDSH